MWLDSKAVNCPQKWGNFKENYPNQLLDTSFWPKKILPSTSFPIRSVFAG